MRDYFASHPEFYPSTYITALIDMEEPQLISSITVEYSVDSNAYTVLLNYQ